MRVWLLMLLASLLLARPAWSAPTTFDCAIDGWRSTLTPKGFRIDVTVYVPRGLAQPVVVEVMDPFGGSHRKQCQGSGSHVVSFFLPLPATAATIDPDQQIPDPDRYNNHFPRHVVLTPWPVFSTDSYVLRYFPGLTFKQGQAPVRPDSAPMLPPVAGPIGLGVGLEGRLENTLGWQMLGNLTPSAMTPTLAPNFSLHGYYLPVPSWGLDGDFGLDLHGVYTTEIGTSLIMWDPSRAPASVPRLVHQLRFAVGHQAPEPPYLPSGYNYGQLTLFRDDTALLGLSSNLTLFGGLDGAWRAALQAQRCQSFSPTLALRLNGTLGWSGGPLAPGNRLGAGLMSQQWLPTGGLASAKLSLLTPLWRGLSIPMGLATLAQVEGDVFVEAAEMVPQLPIDAGGLWSGVGSEVVLVNDTVLNFPLSLELGYAVPTTAAGAFCRPWPGNFYVMVTDPFFPRQPAPAASPAP